MLHLSKSITTVRLLDEIVVIVVVFLSPDFKCMRVHMCSCENVGCCISIFFFSYFLGLLLHSVSATHCQLPR